MSDLNPLLSPPFATVAGIANFRDIASPRTRDNRLITPRLAWRCADPSRVQPEGLMTMSQELGIKTLFDLRSLPEILRDGGSGPDDNGASANAALDAKFGEHGMTRRWTPVFAASDYGPEQIALRYKAYTRSGTEGFVAAYRDILTHAGPAFGEVGRWLASEEATEGQGCVFHCTAGKDRTGLLAALLLLLAGVENEAVAEEYALTDVGLASLREGFVERLMRHPSLNGDEVGVRNMVSSKRENMLASLEMLEQEFGGCEVYLTERCGLTEEELARLRDRLRG